MTLVPFTVAGADTRGFYRLREEDFISQIEFNLFPDLLDSGGSIENDCSFV